MIKLINIPDSYFPEEHRINIFQIGVCLSSNDNSAPYSLIESSEYVEKITQGLSLSLEKNWANIVVFPEVSISKNRLIRLMDISWEIMKSRPENAGSTIICLPLEHLLWDSFEEILISLLAHSDFKCGDNDLSNENLRNYLFELLPPNDYKDAFVNVAILLVFNKSGPEAQGRYFIQPKLYPFPQENTPKRKFIGGKISYLLNIGNNMIMTIICYDMIAQTTRGGSVLSQCIKESLKKSEVLDYLIVPQCNDNPLDRNFQSALSRVYSEFQANAKTLRTLASNVAYKIVNEYTVVCGHSWFVTNPFREELPALGIWERTLPAVYKNSSTGKSHRVLLSLEEAQRLRLPATGEWMLHLSGPKTQELLRKGKGPNISLPAHGGRIWNWNKEAWVEKNRDDFRRECYSSECLELKVLAELSNWIRDNLGGYSPSYEEFAAGAVQVPEDESRRALSLIEDGHDVLVIGAPASGKTIFGFKIALTWNDQTKGTSLFLDLKELEGEKSRFVKEAIEDIESTLNWTQALLLVLDNVHTNEHVAKQLLRFVHELHDRGNNVQTLLLSRLREGQFSDRRSLLDSEALYTIGLNGNEEAFICVARRLLLKAEREHTLNQDMATEWVRLCGSDLVVFAVSFDSSRPNELNKATISKRVYENYIIPAEKQQGGIDPFLTLCAFSSVDLIIEDQAILESSIEVLYPQFVDNGILLRSTKQKRSNNPRLYCRLFHPSLGELILRQSTKFSQHHLKKSWLEHTLKVCQHYPFLLPALYYRLSTGSYERIINFNEWLDAVEGYDGLVEYAFCCYPHETTKVLRGGKLSWSWERLRKLPDDKGYPMLFNQLCRTHVHMVKTVLVFLDEKGLQEERLMLLNELMENEVFRESAAETPADGITPFLKYLCDHTKQTQWEQFLKELLGNEVFYNSVANTPANQIPGLLKYLDKLEYKKESIIIIQYLLQKKEFLLNLEETPAGGITTFLNYLDGCIRRERQPKIRKEMEEGRDQLVRLLLQNSHFRSRMSAADDVVTLFVHLDNHDYKLETEELVKFLSINTIFIRSLVQAPADKVAQFLKYLDNPHRLKKEHNILLDKLWSDDEFWESVKTTPVDKATCFFKYLDDNEMEGRRDEMLGEFLRDEAFKKNVSRTKDAADMVEFFKYLDRCGLEEERNTIIDELWKDNDFWESIRTTPVHKVVSFFEYLDDIGMKDRRDKMLGKFLRDGEYWENLGKRPAPLVSKFNDYLSRKGYM